MCKIGLWPGLGQVSDTLTTLRVAAPGLRWRGMLRGGRIGYLECMISLVQAARVVTGSILIIVGLIAIPLPVTPGLPLIIIGLAFGFSWHPKGLRLLRRCKVKWGRLFKRRAMQS